MDENKTLFLTEEEKNKFIDALGEQLCFLRAKAGVSQEILANFAGISRQTYGAIERKTKRMSWNTYLSFLFFFDYNKKTHDVLRGLSTFPHDLIKMLNSGEPHADFDVGAILKADTQAILDTLDEQALAAIKTVLMMEYSRCNNLSGEAVIKFFEGVDFTTKRSGKKKTNAYKAIKNIKRKTADEEIIQESGF